MADIKIKRSNVTGRVPTTSDLALGELAINTFDGRLFLKRNNGSDAVIEIGGSAAGVASFNTRTGAVTLSSADVTGALGFTPYNSTNPSGYITSSALSSYLPLSGGTVSGQTTINAVGSAGSPTLRLNTSTSSTFVHAQETFAANLTSGQHVISVIGKTGNTKNSGYIGYYWAGDASNSNFVTLGHWGNDDLLRVYGDGNVTVGSNTVLHASNYSSYALPLTGGTLTGDLAINHSSASITAGMWDGANVRVESVGRPLYVVSYGGAISLGRSSGSNLVIDNTSVAFGGNQVLHAGNYTSYSPSLTGSGASGTWGINITGNASTATTLQTARTINGSSFNGSANIDTTEWFHSNRDFPNGTLITTNINYSVTNGDPFVLEIRGNSYGNIIPLDLVYQGYIYSDTIINHGGISNGLNITGLVAINNGGNLCFWFPNQGYWNGYNVKVYSAYATRAVNRVTSIQGVAKPTTNKEVALSANIRQALHSGNYNNYSPSLTGAGASGNWGISITGNAATATAIQTARTINGVSFNGTANITIADSTKLPLTGGTLTGDLITRSIRVPHNDYELSLGYNGTGNGVGVYFNSGADGVYFYNRTGGGNSVFIGRSGGLNVVTGALQQNGNQVLHAGNYTNYSPQVSQLTAGYTVSNFDTVKLPGLYQYDGSMTSTPNNRANYRSIEIGSGGRYSQIAMPWDQDGIWFRRQTDSIWSTWRTVLHDGNYNSYSPTLTGGGASGSWGINVTGSAGSISTSGGYSLTGNGTEGVSSSWISFPNGQGIWSSVNGAHLVPNNTGSYGSWHMYGSRNGWYGLHFGSGSTLMMNADTVGFHREGVGWQMRWAAGTGYVHKGAGGAGTEATILDSSNYSSYAPTLTGNGASGTWGINVTGSASTASYLSTLYAGGQQTNPQVYFNENIGLRVAMTGVPNVWSDTLWINGYAGADVPNMCALHTIRNGTPRMWISSQSNRATAYGTMYEFLTEYNYNNYSPTLTGGGASGTWGINVTGTAATAGTLSSGAVINGTAYFRKNQTAGNYTTASLWTESYDNTSTGIAFHISGVAGRYLEMRNNSANLFWNSSVILNDSNYTSYSPSLTGSGASGTWGINITGSANTANSASNSNTVGGIAPAQFFNNMGNDHGTYTDFNSVPGFGTYYLQGGTNSPTGVGAHQWYGFTLGLGNEYQLSQYGTQLYWPRAAQNADTYLYVRDREGGSWGGWRKTRAGYADSAGTATDSTKLPLTGGTLTGTLGSNLNDLGRLFASYNASASGPLQFYIDHSYGDVNIGNARGNLNIQGSVALHAGNYSSYSPSLTGSGASGTWGINVTGSAGSISTSGGYSLTGSGTEGVSSSWIGFPNGQGIWSSVNGAHLVPNGTGSYGSWHMYGTRNGWYGLHFGSGSTLMMNADTVGFHREGVGWQMRWAVGTGYVHKGAGGGGTEATILDSSNYTSYSPSLTGSGASGTWGINITGNAATATRTSGVSGYAHAGTGMYPFYNWGGANGGASAPSAGSYTTGISVGSNPGDQAYGFQIANNMWNTGLWTRSYNSGFYDWVRLLDSSNYSSYSPSLTGSGASGTWGINVTGSANSLNLSGHTISNSSWAGGGGYHGYQYNGGNFRFGFSSTSGVVDVYADGNFYATDSSHLVHHDGNASRARNSNLMYYQGFTLDANTMDTNATGFTYAVNAPTVGPIARFSTGGGYDLWLNAAYSGGNNLFFRTRNGDAGSINSWRTLVSYGINYSDSIYASIYYDANDTGYYVDPNSTGTSLRLAGYGYFGLGIDGDGVVINHDQIWTPAGNFHIQYSGAGDVDMNYGGGHTFSRTSLRAPIFYDWNDTAYYVDFSATVNNALRMRGGAHFGPNPTWGASLYVGGDGRVGTEATVAVTNGNLHLDSKNGYQMYLNWYSTENIYTKGNLGVGSDSASYRLHVHGTGYATGDFRAPIFYDSDDTAYYVDGNSTSSLHRVNINNNILFTNYGRGMIGTYSADKYQAVFAMGDSYKLPDDGTTTGSLYGLAWSHPNAGGTASNLNTHGLLVLENGNFLAAVSGSIRSRDDMRSPIFYDSNDTAYYLDPNGTSKLVGNQHFISNRNTSSDTPPLQAFSDNGGGAIMAFHRGGYYAVNFGLDSDNVIRIGGWSAAANRLQMDMSGNLTMAGNVTAYSDERLKTDWESLASNFVENLAEVKSGTYTRIDSGERQAGSSAQDWQKLLPEVVTAGNDDDQTLALAYGNAALVSAVELAKRVVEQDARIAKLEMLIEQLLTK